MKFMKDAETIFAASSCAFDNERDKVDWGNWPEGKKRMVDAVAEWYISKHPLADEDEVGDVTDVASVVLDELFDEHMTEQKI